LPVLAPEAGLDKSKIYPNTNPTKTSVCWKYRIYIPET